MGCGSSVRFHDDPDLLSIVRGARVAVVATDNKDARSPSTGPVFAMATVERVLAAPRSYVLRVDNRAERTRVKAAHVREAADRSQDRAAGDLFVLPERSVRAVERSTGSRIVAVWVADGALRDATVRRRLGKARYELKMADGGSKVRCALNNANHAAQRFASVAEYHAARTAYLTGVIDHCAFVEDAITGNQLQIEEQLIYIETAPAADGAAGLQRSAFDVAKSVKDLVPLLAAPAPARHEGVLEATPLLVRAGPGTGKTWSMQQLHCLLAKRLRDDGGNEGVPLVPLVVYVQRLARILNSPQPEHKGFAERDRASAFVRMYILDAFGSLEAPETKLLLMAYEMNALVLLLDGIDEAAGLRVPIERLVFEELLPRGMRFVVTSRPAGVDARLEDYRRRFVVMDLLPLSETQQDAVIKGQLGENAFYEHLHEFSEIRKRHDALYAEVFSSKERACVEGLAAPDRFKREGTDSFDPAMRQRCLDGRRVVRTVERAPRSAYLRRLDGLLRAAGALERLDAEGGAATLDVDAREPSWGLAEKADRKVVARLAKLQRKRSVKEESAVALWKDIMRRTDEIYVVAESFKGVFEEIQQALTLEFGDSNFVNGPLKDPVRIVEKAADDYATRFDDGELPEACVADVIRARLVCDEAATVVAVLQWLAKQKRKKLKDGSTARIELVRAKNKFAVPDPTHFRNVLLNLRLWHGEEIAMLIEIQVHHARILKYNEVAHAHDHYEYFRERLRGSYEEALGNDLDFYLERRMAAFAEICRIPVQLSMLCVVLQAHGRTHSEEGAALRLPSSQRELYEAAVEAVLEMRFDRTEERAAARRLLTQLAVANNQGRRREFTALDAERALAEDTEARALWRTLLASAEGAPLVKTIVLGEAEGEFQFKHLSFQEALFVHGAVRDASVAAELWRSRENVTELLNEGFLQNVFRIGGAELASCLPCSNELTMEKELSVVGQVSLALLLPGLGCTHLRFELTAIKGAGAEALCAALARSGVREFDVSACTMDATSGETIGRAVAGGATWELRLGGLKELPLRALYADAIEDLDLSNARLGDAAAGILAGALRCNRSLRSLNVRGNEFSPSGTNLLLAAVASNDALRETLDMGDDYADWVRTTVDALRDSALKQALKDRHRSEVRLEEMELCSQDAVLLAEYICFNPCLRVLSLAKNSLGAEGGKAIGAALEKNAALQTLDLKHNRIGDEGGKAIGAALEKNAALQTLNLQSNLIGDEGGKAIGVALEKNAVLQTLNLRDNFIGVEGGKAIGATLEKNAALQTLDLNCNSIGAEGGRAIGAGLEKNAALQTVNLHSNSIGDEGGKAIGVALEKNAALQTLNLQNNSIGDEGGKAIGAALEKNAALRTLDLKHNRIGDEGGKAIGAALEMNAALQKLDLEHNRIGDEGGKAIGAALEKNAALQTLNLQDNSIDAEGGKAIGAALEKNAALQTLNLHGNLIHVEGGKAIGAALEKNAALQTLNLHGNLIHVEGGKAIGAALEKNAALQTLNLENNSIGAEGGRAIGAALEKNAALQTLNLNRNSIGAEGGKATGAALEKNAVLQTLNLYRNSIGDGGGKALGAALEKNAALQTLNLHGNSIGDEGGKAIGAALENNTALQKLDLEHNRIGDEGGKAVGVALEKNAALQTLNLRDNFIRAEGGKAIGAALEKNATLQTLNLTRNEIGAEGAMALRAALEKNAALQTLDIEMNAIGDEGGKAIGAGLEKNTVLRT